jgi:membrane-associated phospholipid phosphatase
MFPTSVSLARFTRRLLWLGVVAASSLSMVRGQMASPPPPAFPPGAWQMNGIRPEHIWTGAYAKLVWDDTLGVATAPSRWDGGDWLEVGGAVAAIAVTTPFDRSIRRYVQARRTAGEDRFMARWQNLGYSYSFAVLAGFELWGEVGENTKAKKVAMDGVASSIIAAGLITPALKFVVGRDRPRSNHGTYRFAPFTSNISFPSGHSAQAFAIATVIAGNYHQWWVGTLAYGSAALVGYARIEQDAHFASDVVAGAIIGVAVARSVVHRNDGPRHSNELSWTPYASGHGGGLVFYKSF